MEWTNLEHNFYKVPPIVFWTSVRSGNVSLTSTDLTSMLIKSVVFGLLISIIACGYGLTTKGVQKKLEQVQQAQL